MRFALISLACNSSRSTPGASTLAHSRGRTTSNFRSVFSDSEDAVSLLRVYVPRALARTVNWSTLAVLPDAIRRYVRCQEDKESTDEASEREFGLLYRGRCPESRRICRWLFTVPAHRGGPHCGCRRLTNRPAQRKFRDSKTVAKEGAMIRLTTILAIILVASQTVVAQESGTFRATRSGQHEYSTIEHPEHTYTGGLLSMTGDHHREQRRTVSRRVEHEHGVLGLLEYLGCRGFHRGALHRYLPVG